MSEKEISHDHFERAVTVIALTAVRFSFGSEDAAVLVLAEAIIALNNAGPGASSSPVAREIIEALRVLNPEAFLPKAASAGN